MKQLWVDTVNANVSADAHLNIKTDLKTAMRELKKEQLGAALGHVQSLSLQGASITSILDSYSSSAISKWSKVIVFLPTTLSCFVRKAISQQLPTQSNLYRWRKTNSDQCLLCGNSQSNKHVLNNCSSNVALLRYRQRHDEILGLICGWLKSQLDQLSV